MQIAYICTWVTPRNSNQGPVLLRTMLTSSKTSSCRLSFQPDYSNIAASFRLLAFAKDSSFPPEENINSISRNTFLKDESTAFTRQILHGPPKAQQWLTFCGAHGGSENDSSVRRLKKVAKIQWTKLKNERKPSFAKQKINSHAEMQS